MCLILIENRPPLPLKYRLSFSNIYHNNLLTFLATDQQINQNLEKIYYSHELFKREGRTVEQYFRNIQPAKFKNIFVVTRASRMVLSFYIT